MRQLRWITLVAVLAVASAEAGACPNCRESVADTQEAGVDAHEPAAVRSELSSGFNASIWVMLGGVGLSLGLVGTLVTRVARSSEPASG